jgi:hypothetical protein
MSSAQPESNTLKTGSENAASSDAPQSGSPQSESPDLEAVSGQSSSETALPAAESRAPQAAPASAQNRSAWPGRLVIAGLIVALLLSGGLLLSEKQKTAALEGSVATLNVELVEAEAALATHEVRLGLIRDQVGDIFSRVGTLQGLVNSEGIPSMAAFALASDELSPTVVSEPQSQSLVTEPQSLVTEPFATEFSNEAASESVLPESPSEVGGALDYGQELEYAPLDTQIAF